MNLETVLWREDIRAVFVAVVGLAHQGGLLTPECAAVVGALAGALGLDGVNLDPGLTQAAQPFTVHQADAPQLQDNGG